MLNQKDNDFDDLFRRASDKYPLRTDSADWDRMSAALDNPPFDIPEEVVDVDRRRKRRFLWFFLLFPIVGGGYYLAQRGGGHGGAGQTGVKTEQTTAQAGQQESVVAAGAEKKDIVKSGVPEGITGANGTSGAGASLKDAGANTNKPGGGSADGKIGGIAGNGKIGGAENVKMSGRVKNRKTGNSAENTSKIRNTSETENESAIVTGHRRKKGGAVSGAGKEGEAGTGGVNGEENFDAAKVTLNNGSAASRVANYPVNRVRTNGDYNLTVNVQAPVVEKDSSKTTAKASSKKKSSYLYAGLLAAPDLSTVRFQKMDGVGTTYTLLLGYQFNKRWSIESGVSLDRKKYYTDGEYFDTKNVNFNPNWKLKSVDGICYMWEIPINVRYNLSSNEKNKWFVTAGLSTYLMTSEKYSYYYTAPTWSGASQWPPQKASQYWFSIINLSAGYEHRLGRIGNLRIEPYLRIPVTGLGTGKLNILSSGLNIGITRRLW